MKIPVKQVIVFRSFFSSGMMNVNEQQQQKNTFLNFMMIFFPNRKWCFLFKSDDDHDHHHQFFAMLIDFTMKKIMMILMIIFMILVVTLLFVEFKTRFPMFRIYFLFENKIHKWRTEIVITIGNSGYYNKSPDISFMSNFCLKIEISFHFSVTKKHFLTNR